MTKAAAAVSPAVVTITSGAVSASDPLDAATGVGSGVIYDAAGWILTNRHVVCGTGDLTVRLADGRQFPATTYGIDTLTDLAIVHVDAPTLPAASIGDSEALKPGQLSLAIGSSLGTLTTTVTSSTLEGNTGLPWVTASRPTTRDASVMVYACSGAASGEERRRNQEKTVSGIFSELP